MEASIKFFLWWRGIIEDNRKDFLMNYLNIFKAYIHLGVVLDNIEALNFYTLKTEKSSKEKYEFEFLSNF